MSLDRSLAEVRGRIAAACARAGRDTSSVTLVAVSKTVAAARVRELLFRGHAIFGENRVQEALRKIEETGAGARWHLVGHLQSNKARHAVGVFEMIHSVDGEALALELDRRARAAGVVQRVLVQVNLAREETKSGVGRERAIDLLRAVRELPSLDARGLMTIPPAVDDAERSRPWFAALRAIRDEARDRLGAELPELSMGMSGDFEVAIEEGATIVRVGSAIFGERSL